MRELLRVAVRVALAGVLALGLAAALLGPFVDDDAEVSVVAMMTVVGAAIAFELLRAARRSGHLTWQRAVPLWSSSPHAEPLPVPDGVHEWEALLVAARQDDRRSRERLLRRMAPLAGPGAEPLLAAISEARPDEVHARVVEFVQGGHGG